MTDALAQQPCRNCRQPRDETDLDAYGWCEACRAVIIRRATLAARFVAVLGASGFGIWVFSAAEPGPRSLIFWLVLIVAVYYVLYKLTQRVSFEIIRSRGVPPPAH